MESISTIPVTMLVGLEDDLCLPELAYEQMLRIETRANFIRIEGVGHSVASVPG